jgi:GTP cyclohydrolase IA
LRAPQTNGVAAKVTPLAARSPNAQAKGLDVSAAAHPLTDEPARLGSRPQLQVVSRSPAVDLARAEQAVAELLAALGQDPSSEQLAETPRRVAASYAELLTPVAFTPTTFPNDEGYDELVLVKAIPFSSLCQHHLLPFVGVAHVGYLPAGRILGLSKLARVVELFAHRLQLQERLTTQVADWLQDLLEPNGVGVVLEAEHQCMSLRGVQATGARTVTSTLHGLLRSDPRSRQEFFALTGISR